MNSTDRILDYIQREVELDGRSHTDCVFITDLSFSIDRKEYRVPSIADLESAENDVEWFFMSAKAGRVVPHPNPDSSFWKKYFGENADPYGHSWNLEQLFENLRSPEAWRRAILYNPKIARNPPCVVYYQFQQIGSYLDVTANLRSSDVYKVLPQDVVMTDLILRKIASVLGVNPGRLTFNIGNAHCFYEDMENVEESILDWGD